MDCKKAKQYMSDCKDFRLPERVAIRLSAHICGCAKCSHEMDILHKQASHLKMLYPDIAAPIGFSSRVMDEISRSSHRPVPMVVPFKLKRLLMPVAAMAACAAMIIGLYYEGAFVTVLPAVYEQPQALMEEEALVSELVPKEEPYQNGNVIVANVSEDNETTILPPLALPEEPADNESPVENGLKPVDLTDDIAVATITPVVNDTPALPDRLSGSSLATVYHVQNGNEYTALADSSSFDIIPLGERNETVKADMASIPDFSIFVPRDRIINSVSVNIVVGRIDEALKLIERTELSYGIAPDVTETNLLADGTITMGRSYTVPLSFVNSMVVGMSSIGVTSEVKRSRIDITADYKDLLESHIKLIREFSDTGKGAADLRDLASRIMRLDNMARSEVSNIILTIEDKIDF